MDRDREQAAPPVVSTPTPKKKRNSAVWIISLVVLAIIIGTGAVFGAPYLQSFLQTGTPASTPQNQPGATATQAQPGTTPTMTAWEDYKQLAQQQVQNMSLDELIGQLIVVNPLDLNEVETLVSEQHIGGVIFYTYSLIDKKETQEYIQELQNTATIPLFMAADGEGGNVYRLQNIYPDDPFMLGSEVRETDDPEVAAEEGRKTAERFAELGLNTSFAPTVDIYEDEDSFMIYRSFGDTPEDVIKYVGPNLTTLQEGGIIGTLKHFPGMGRAPEDPHMGVVEVDVSREELYEVDLAPFKHFIESTNIYEQPGMIMPTYILVPEIDPEQSAQFSHIFMTEILREEFGYDGVVVTDALTNMVPADELGIGPASVLSLQAGCDLLLGARNTMEVTLTIEAIKDALNNGELTQERLEEAATRILALKMQYQVMPTP